MRMGRNRKKISPCGITDLFDRMSMGHRRMSMGHDITPDEVLNKQFVGNSL